MTTATILATCKLATTIPGLDTNSSSRSPEHRAAGHRAAEIRETRCAFIPTIRTIWVMIAIAIGCLNLAMGLSPAFGQNDSVTDAAKNEDAGQEIIVERTFNVSSGEGQKPKRLPLQTIRYSFDPADDLNFDQWPDGWKRYRGVGYPRYVTAKMTVEDSRFADQVKQIDQAVIKAWQSLREPAVRIDEANPFLQLPSVVVPSPIPFLKLTRIPNLVHALPSLPPSIANYAMDGSLKVELDGGQFKAESPVMPATEMYQYGMSCKVRTQGIRHDSARFELSFVRESETKNDSGKRGEPQVEELLTVSSEPVKVNGRWVQPVIEMVQPPPQTSGMVARLIVERSQDGFEDIRGTIEFDDVRIEKHPQLMIDSDHRLGIYTINDPITIKSRILGLEDLDAMIHFQMIDSDNRLVDEESLPINPKNVRSKRNDATVRWTPKSMGAGFFHVRAVIKATRVGRIQAETTIAVVDPALDGTPHGPFGWTMPQNQFDISTRNYAKWLTQLGVAWVKYPCWIDADDVKNAEDAAALMIRLQDSGIETVGVLDQPPPEKLHFFSLRSRRDLVAAELFRDINVWKPELESIMSRLTLKVRRWQLGHDRDYSFVGRPRLKDSINQISQGLQGFGQPLSIAIAWPWTENQLPDHDTSWQATCRSINPPMQAAELDHFLSLEEQESRSSAGPSTWLLIDPIDSSQYSRDDRTRDLILRMATVRSHRVEAAFVSDPFNPALGLLDANGRPGDLLLPWRTTSRLIGNLRNVGSLQLRGGSQNIVFAGAERAVVMLWSAKPTKEKIYFGDNVQQIDAFGRVRDLPTVTDSQQPHQVIEVGPVPTFIVRADPMLIAFRMSVEVEPTQFDALLGETQKLKVHFANPLRDSIVGLMRVATPAAWQISDPVRSWEALGGRSVSETFEVTLNNSATIGNYEIPIQFELDTIPPRLVTVYRETKVGPEGLDVTLTTRLLPSGEMRLRITATNSSRTQQSYNTLLFPPGRQYHSTFLTIPANDTLEREIYFEDGEDLVGRRMTLRAIEQDGSRVLNYTFDIRR